MIFVPACYNDQEISLNQKLTHTVSHTQKCISDRALAVVEHVESSQHKPRNRVKNSIAIIATFG